ncbi:MAG: cytochrome c biogenesis protein DipZ [Acidimicrobiales bacterium]
MFGLIVIGFVAGIVAGISPCILPVLPVVLVAGATAPGVAKPSWWRAQARPLSVVLGLVVSFSVLILAGSEIISALGLPGGFLRDTGIAVLAAVGVSFIFPAVSALLERPFSRLTARRQPDGKAGGFVLGLGLGLLFVPCAGPILAAITVAGATRHVGWTAVFLTIAFAVGAAIPLLVVAVAGGQLAQRTKALRLHAPRVRQVSGVIVLGMALAIALNAFSGLQRDVPGYTSALQNSIEGGASVRKQLSALSSSHGTLASCSATATKLLNCGPAPKFADVTAWLNTPGGAPLSLAQLRGKVVLVDFWTYSCINCQRTLPHVEAWYSDYAADGFVVVGVHTPEFAFEHVVSNVTTEAAALGVKYPIDVDDDYGTWNAYQNEYWPADYLIDAQGNVRHISFGEGGYSDTETLIRQLLASANPHAVLPRRTDVADTTPTGQQSPETYVGYEQEEFIVNPNLAKDAPVAYRYPASLRTDDLALGGTWTEGAQEATAGTGAEMELGFLANDVYLVMGGSGTVEVSINGKPAQTVTVAGVPQLYTLFQSNTPTTAVMQLTMSPGVQAYDFTFG